MYTDNSITASIKRSKTTHVRAGELPQSTQKWEVRVKGKVWVSENSFIVENASYVADGDHVRQFYVYRSQEAFDRGIFFDSARNLLHAKLKAENFKPKKGP